MEKVLISLTRKFDLITIDIKESKDLSLLTLVEVHGRLQTYEHRIKDWSDNIDQALQGKLKINNHPLISKDSTSTILSSTSRGHGRGQDGSCHGICYHGRGRGQSTNRS